MHKFFSNHFFRKKRGGIAVRDVVRGFTLIEVLIVLAISVILTSVVLTYSASGRDQVYLGIQKAQLAQVISKAKSLAISTYNQPDVPCGYGVWFDYSDPKQGRYEIFRYKISPCSDIRNLGIAIKGAGYNSESKNQYLLPPNVNFGDGADRLDIVFFLPPDPKTFIWQLDNLKDAGGVYLKTSNASVKVGVNSAGQITF